MKHLKSLFLALVAMLALSACDKEENIICTEPDPWPFVVLNNGNWGSNDACLTQFDMSYGTIVDHLFEKANGQHLGDLGQDIVKVGDEFYIAVNGSQTIFVTDADFVVKHQIVAEADGQRLSPRYFCPVEGKVYVTYYEGYLGEISVRDYSVRTTKVGMNPEGLAYLDGKIYVANSGGLNYENGYDNTVSVVNASSFTEEKKITVNVNPQMVVADKTNQMIYVNSFGNYADVPAKLQSVSVLDGVVKDLDYTDVKGMAPSDMGDGRLFVVTGSYDEDWKVQGTVNVYDMKQQAKVSTPAVMSVKDYYSISVAKGFVCVGTSDYKTSGDVYVFDGTYNLRFKIDANGLNPIKVVERGK